MHRILNDAQHRLLDRIAKDEPLARVVGWFDNTETSGPVIRKDDGSTVVANAATGRARAVNV